MLTFLRLSYGFFEISKNCWYFLAILLQINFFFACSLVSNVKVGYLIRCEPVHVDPEAKQRIIYLVFNRRETINQLIVQRPVMRCW